MKVAIVDYGMCNLDSVARAVEECGGDPVVISDPSALTGADRIILPGVGAFAQAMTNLRAAGFEPALRESALVRRVPFLGICLGMQLLATKGFEGGETDGLGWIGGDVRRLEPSPNDSRIPHIGWNEVHVVRQSPLFDETIRDRDVYFVHSFHFVPNDLGAVVATTPYCGGFVSVLQSQNIFGVQFHPEKSQKVGFRILSNFLKFKSEN